MPRLPVLEEEAEPREVPINDDAKRIGNKLSISPNPGSDQITILWQRLENLTDRARYHLVVTNALTGQVWGTHIIQSGQEKSIDTSTWPSGMYHLAVRDQQTGIIVESQKVVIQH